MENSSQYFSRIYSEWDLPPFPPLVGRALDKFWSVAAGPGPLV